MAYGAWSVIAGEQPTTSKWNILGSNDSSFNDGTGIGANAITGAKIASYSTQRRNNSANVVESAALLQTGWVAGQPGVASTLNITITFPVAYVNPPIIVVSFGGDTAGVTATLGLGAATVNNAYAEAISVTNTNFVMRFVASSNWAANNTVYGTWTALGV